MAKFEKYKPHLRTGQITPQGEKLIYECENPVDQIVLPIEQVDFLLLCNGDYTVQEIIENLYLRKGSIQFKAIYRTLLYLRDRGFLINGDELEIESENSPTQRDSNLFTFKPYYELNIGKRIYNETTRPVAFYITALCTILFAIASFTNVQTSWFTFDFFHLNGSYARGAMMVFLVSSILLTIKNLYKCLLLIFLTGRAYNFGFVFNGFAFYFRVRSDSLFLVSNKLYLTLFHAAVTLIYFPIVSAAYNLLPLHEGQAPVMAIATMLFLFDLSPFHDSELSYLMRWIFNDDNIIKLSSYMQNKPLLAFITPGEKRAQMRAYKVFSFLTLTWCVLMFYIAFGSIISQHNTLIRAFKNDSLPNKICAFIAFCLLLSVLAAVAYNSLQIIKASYFKPLEQFVQKLLKVKNSKNIALYDNKQVILAMRKLPLFNYLNRELLELIIDRSSVKIYKAHAPIILQGDSATHLYVLLNGSVQVQLQTSTGPAKHLNEIMPVSIFGEIAIIEESKRAASIYAKEDSVVIEIPARMIRQIAQENLHAHEIESFRNAILVNQFFASAPVFRDLNENVIENFMAKGKIETYAPDQIVFRQGDPGNGFFLVLRGAVNVGVNDKIVSRIEQGGFFGEISMIADVPRTATVFAHDQVRLLRLGRDAFWEILALDINMAMFIESVGEMRIREDIELIRTSEFNQKADVA